MASISAFNQVTLASDSTFTFGGTGGGFYSIDPKAIVGKQIYFFSGDVIDKITIGSDSYGRGSARMTGRAEFPKTNSTFTLYNLKGRNYSYGETSHAVITYIKAKINGSDITVGNDSDTAVIQQDFTQSGIQVQIVGIYAGDFVDAIVFKWIGDVV